MTELAARVSANAALPVFRAYPGRAGSGTPVKSNGVPERWVLAARLSRVTKKDQARGDALVNGSTPRTSVEPSGHGMKVTSSCK